MKNRIIFSVFLCLITNVTLSQERGDNFLGLNFGTSETSQKSSSNTDNRSTTTSLYSLGINYSHFIKLNRKINIGVGVNFNEFDNNLNRENQKANGLSLYAGYGLLFNIYEDFYIGIDPGIGYSTNKITSKDLLDTLYTTRNRKNELFTSAGITWIPMKHFGLALTLISANLGYSSQKFYVNGLNESVIESIFLNFNNSGSLQNQTFTVFYKFK